MIDINLLNSKKLKDSNSDFFDIDKSLLDKINTIENESDKNNKQSSIEIKSNQKKNISKKSLSGLFIAFILLIIGPYFFYYFSEDKKIEFSSQNIKRMIFSILDDKNIELLSFRFDNEALNMELGIDNDYFDNVKVNIKNQLNKIDDSHNFKLERFEKILSISSLYSADILNIRYNPNLDKQDYDLLDQNNVDKKLLKEILHDFFKVNNPNLINFQINANKVNHYGYYDIFFIRQ